MLYWLIGVLILVTVKHILEQQSRYLYLRKEKSSLATFDVEMSCRLASVRVHVELFIGLLRKKYTILQGILPLDYLIKKDGINLTTIDKIAVVCTALTNMCNSVIPVE